MTRGRQRPGRVNEAYARAHREALAVVAKALGMTLDDFMGTRTKEGIIAAYRQVDLREHRRRTAQVFRSIEEAQWPEVRAVFAYVCCRSEDFLDRLRKGLVE
ncbi:MAG: hypothetical protein Q8Q00_10825 [Dehalococcoidia bacterium]|nr:hypothetical protein [Dehalococcoidia bacterium]